MNRRRKTLDWLNEPVSIQRKRWQVILSLLWAAGGSRVVQNQISDLQRRTAVLEERLRIRP